MKNLFHLSISLTLAIFVQAAGAEPLGDPTRPMDFIYTPGVSTATARPSGPELQSTLVSPQRKSAVISGKPVKVGDMYDGAVVAEITPYEVHLSRSGRETILRLSPKLTKEKGKAE